MLGSICLPILKNIQGFQKNLYPHKLIKQVEYLLGAHVQRGRQSSKDVYLRDMEKIVPPPKAICTFSKDCARARGKHALSNQGFNDLIVKVTNFQHSKLLPSLEVSSANHQQSYHFFPLGLGCAAFSHCLQAHTEWMLNARRRLASIFIQKSRITCIV